MTFIIVIIIIALVVALFFSWFERGSDRIDENYRKWRP